MDKPSPARVYDYLLGGYHNFEVDRLLAKKAIELYPEVGLVAQALRSCLRRVVNFLLERGVEQFLDIGAGIPTVGNTHEIVMRANPGARIVYVDIDPVAVAHAKTMLQGNPNVVAIWGDVRQPQEILKHPDVQSLLDFRRPVAVLLLAILQYVVDDDAAHRAVGTLREALASGSYMAISQGTPDGAPPQLIEQMERLSPATLNRQRTRAQIQEFFEGFEMVEPGVVYIPLWWPEGPDDLFLDRPAQTLVYVGVGRKP